MIRYCQEIDGVLPPLSTTTTTSNLQSRGGLGFDLSLLFFFTMKDLKSHDGNEWVFPSCFFMLFMVADYFPVRVRFGEIQDKLMPRDRRSYSTGCGSEVQIKHKKRLSINQPYGLTRPCLVLCSRRSCCREGWGRMRRSEDTRKMYFALSIMAKVCLRAKRGRLPDVSICHPPSPWERRSPERLILNALLFRSFRARMGVWSVFQGFALR
jgi:hypothetical protein